MNKQPTELDQLAYLATLVTSEDQVISRIYMMDGADLYKVDDEHYVCLTCANTQHRHQGRALLERVLPQNWECFASAVNVDLAYEVYHYGPAES